MTEQEPKNFELTVRNKFIALKATTADEFIKAIEAHLEYVRAVAASGASFDAQGVPDDYARFTTTDPEVAAKFGFSEEWHEGDETEDDAVEYYAVKADSDDGTTPVTPT